MSANKTKDMEYTQKILLQIMAMLREDSENSIDMEDFDDPENFKSFIHALATSAPTMIFNRLGCVEGEGAMNWLEFNHMANQLCFEKSEKV